MNSTVGTHQQTIPQLAPTPAPKELRAVEPSENALVAIKPDGTKPPLFCVHAQAGHVRLFEDLATHLPADRPLYGLRAVPGVEQYRRFEGIAASYVDEIRQFQPSGPYFIMAECRGGALAYELAQQFRALGEEVPLLALIDAFPPHLPKLRPRVPGPLYRTVRRMRMLTFHLVILTELDAMARRTYATARAKRLFGALTARASERRAASSSGLAAARAFGAAFNAYDPRAYGGPVVLFRAARLPWGIQRTPDLGWAGLVDHLEIVELPGYFGTIMLGPRIRRFAGRLAERL